MRFGLDYDGTFDLDSEFWRKFIDLAESHGHEVVIVTARPLASWGHQDVLDGINGRVPVFFTDLAQKEPFMDNKNKHVDIWIDDNPVFIPKKEDWPL